MQSCFRTITSIDLRQPYLLYCKPHEMVFISKLLLSACNIINLFCTAIMLQSCTITLHCMTIFATRLFYGVVCLAFNNYQGNNFAMNLVDWTNKKTHLTVV